MSFHKRMKELRDELGLTQEEIASRINISQNGYSKIERGESSVTYETLMRIKDKLQIPKKHFEYLLYGNEEDKMNPMILRERYEDADTEMILDMINNEPKLKKILLEIARFSKEQRNSLIDSFQSFMKLFKKNRP